MKKLLAVWESLALFTLVWSFHAVSLAQTDLRTGLWQPITLDFSTNATYANPYRDVSLSATFTGPGGEQIVLEGYWNGGQNWQVRFAPSRVGAWQFITASSDPQLRAAGQIVCEPSNLPGPVRVSSEYPTKLVHADGTPFFWMGETSWRLLSPATYESRNNSPVDTTYAAFQSYIDRRASQHFNMIRCVFDNNRNEGGATFFNDDKDLINPSFFQSVDRRLDYMASKGVGIEVVLTWAQQFVEYTDEQFQRYARYVVARYAAYPIVFWNISGEFQEAGEIADYSRIGELIRARDPYRQPITIHPSGNRSNDEVAGEPWLDIIMQQRFESDSSIALSDLLQRLGRSEVPVLANVPTVEITAPDLIHRHILDDRRHNKPVINSEFGYEQYDGRTGLPNRTSPEAVRKLAWGIVMAGGYFCYGMEATYREFFSLPQQELGGSENMRHLYEFMMSTNFNSLEPHDELVAAPAMCLADPGKEYVIYAPTGGSVVADLPVTEFTAQWFNPRTGNRLASFILAGGNGLSVQAPGSNDWTLHLKRSPTGEIGRLEITPVSVKLPYELAWQFRATGITVSGERQAVGPVWTVTGGKITVDGVYTAPQSDGTYEVQANYSGLIATAEVNVSGSMFEHRTEDRGFAISQDLGGWHGTYVCDYDNDGFDDLFMTSHGSGQQDDSGRNALWRNRGDGTFEEVALAAGVDGGLHGRFTRELHGASWLDFDNDGDFDLFMPNTDAGADDHRWSGIDELYQNNGDGIFEQVLQSGLSAEEFNRRGACAGDFNNDGWIDLFVVNMSYWRNNENQPSQPYRALYLNNGNGSFTPQQNGIEWIDWAEGCTTLDFDQDGDVDIIVADDGSGDGLHLWENDGHGFFQRALASGLPVTGDFNGSVLAADLNSDGLIDLFTAEFDNGTHRGRSFLNQGGGTFQAGPGFGGAEHMIAADLDNDGDLDIISDGVFFNDGKANFSQINTGLTAQGRGGMAFDADNDGDLDVIFNRSDRTAPYLLYYENQLTVGNWLKIKLINKNGAAGAPGAKLWLYKPGKLDDATALLGYREVVTATGFVSGPSPVQHFGLGDFASADLRVRFLDGGEIVRTNQIAGKTVLIDAAGSGGGVITAIAEADRLSGCLPLTVRFNTARSQFPGNATVRYDWDFGDGARSTTSNPVHTFWAAGRYRVVLRISSSSGFSATTELQITVLDSAVAPVTTALVAPTHYRTALLQTGERYYLDRGFQLLSLPAELQGARFILTANDDKQRSDAQWLRFTIDQPANIYVAYDPRASNLPLWLRPFEATGKVISVSDAEVGFMRMFKREYAPGEIVLGGNLAEGAVGALSNYFVAIAAKQCSDEATGSGSPSDFWLGQSYPNPYIIAADAQAGSAARISFRVPQTNHVEIAIYDVLGRRVRTLIERERGAGSYEIPWDGRDQAGNLVGNGLYFYRMVAGDFSQTRRLVVLRH